MSAGIVLYNTMTRDKRPFTPINEGEVRIYACGPTVYGDPHIGNFRSFVAADVLHRWFTYRGYNVRMIMNITDIDDKTIRDSGKAGIPISDFTKKYTLSFLRGLDLLKIRRVTAYPRATSNIKEMIQFIQVLIDKGAAYIAEDGIYFDIDKFPNYGKLSGIDLASQHATERMQKDEYDKESTQDFALWKRSTLEQLDRSKKEEGISWDAEWTINGEKVVIRGRPGWHIECSVMSRNLLGDTLDIHIGGEDLVFPHHENEIAQSESRNGKPFVHYWIHIRHLMINGKKMSKSLGNFIGFDEVLTKYSSDAFRYFYLNTHYRRPLDYTDDAMQVAANSSKKLENTLDIVDAALKGHDKNLDYGPREETLVEEIEKQKKVFEAAMDDDLDSHSAIDALHVMSGAINEYLQGSVNKGVLLKSYYIYRALLDSLGLFELRGDGPNELTEQLIKTMIDMRSHFREEKNYTKADEIRKKLASIGITLSDTAEGTTWKISK